MIYQGPSWDVREKWTKPPFLNFELDEYEERLSKLRGAMDEQGLQCIIVHGSPNYMDGNLRYISGFESSYGNSFLLVTSEDEPVLITDSVPYNEAMHAQVFQTWIKDLRFIPPMSSLHDFSEAFVDIIHKILSEKGYTKLGIASKPFFPAIMLEQLKSRMPSASFQYVDSILQQARCIKTQKETEALQAAAKIADIGMDKVFESIKPGVTELEICARAISAIIENGGQNIWNLPPVTCVSGPYSCFREVYPTARKLEQGDLVSIGLGCNYNGYQTRIHRSIPVGNPNNEQKKLLETAISIQEALTGTIQFGVKIGDLIEIQKSMLKNTGYEKQDNFFLGRGIGTDMFVDPVLIDGIVPYDEITEGMLLVIGPSISIEGLGTACFQDTVLIDDKSHQILNKCKKRFW